MQFVELSHTIESGMITYKGLPAPAIQDHLTFEESKKIYAEGTVFCIKKIEMVANTGTYMDSPFHRYPDGIDLAQLPLSSIADLQGMTITVSPPTRSIDQDSFEGINIEGKAVLVCTGWSRHWRTDQYFEGHPYLTSTAAEYLVQNRAALVGIDSFNIDDTADRSRPVHSLLLGAGIPIVEHLTNLQALPASGYRFFAVPPRIRDFGTFPVRAFAILSSV